MDLLQTLWDAFSGDVVKFLPISPFRKFLDAFADIEYLGMLNWFVPVGDMLIVLGAWVSVIAGFYLISIVLRWLKVIGD